jgi:hypothetical protein
LALGARRAISRFGHVPREYIHADSTFTDLEALPSWSARIDVYFDGYRFYRLLQMELKRTFSTKLMEKLPDAEGNMRLTVGGFASAVVDHFIQHDRGSP